MNLQEKIDIIPKIMEDFDKVIYWQNKAKKEIIKWFIANEHVLIEALPWLWKTELIKSLAQSSWLDYKRIQWTPDLMPQDILWYTNLKGVSIKWPIMTNILLVDEINRINPKTLSALLSAMSERIIVDTDTWKTIDLPDDFIVIATQNPTEIIWTFELPEATKDRFSIKIGMEKEKDTLLKAYELNKDELPCDISNNLFTLINDIFDNLDPKISKHNFITENFKTWPSIRAWLQFIKMVKVNAFVNWRDFAVFKDIVNNIIPVFSDKIVLSDESEYNWENVNNILTKFINQLDEVK